MLLSMSTSALDSQIAAGLDGRGVIEAISKCGFRAVDYDLTREDVGKPLENGKKLREILAEFGVAAPQAHATGGSLENCFFFCREAGIPAIVVHPIPSPENDRKEFFEINQRHYKAVAGLCDETGVGLLVENIGNPMDPYFLKSGADLAELVDIIDHPLCTACWDIGHANHFPAENYPQYESIKALGSRLTAIHFHDNCGNFNDPDRHIRVDMHMAPFMSWVGTVNFDSVLQGLIDIDYKGTFNLELTAGQSRRFVPPFIRNGEAVSRLNYLPTELWIEIYSTVYKIGKYMLTEYGVFEG